MDDRARAEVERIHMRYAVEVVEALGMCPWAKTAREAGRTRTLICEGSTGDVDATLALLDAVEREPHIEVALIVYPVLDLDRMPFARFIAEVREADAKRKPVGETVLAMADFHPNAIADTSTAERLVPFVRKTPDPTLQAVRKSALQSVRMTENQGTAFVDISQISFDGLVAGSSTPTLASRIARNNLKTIETLGLPHVETIFRDILRDRHESYAVVGLPRPAWSK